jgi:LacI family transcriptional regulator, galactose operon repressor
VPSLEDVAALAMVSTATVSRVLSGSSHPVAERTRHKVLEAARELDFEPNTLARGLARSRTHTVAVMVHDVMDEYFSEIARGIEDEAYANGYVTLICNTDRDPAKEVHYLRKLRAMQIDAILFASGGLRDRNHRTEVHRQLAQIEAAGGVIVRLAPHEDGKPDVGFSNDIGLRLAVDHLVELGHRSIGFLAGPARLTTSAERLSAMRRALKRHGIVLSKSAVLDSGFSRSGGEEAATTFVAIGSPATAMIGANDQAAIGFVRGLRAQGVAVPDDVSVVGFDDISPCKYIEPPLTTVHVPLYELGVRGLQLVLDLLAGHERPRPVSLPLELTIRSSTARPNRQFVTGGFAALYTGQDAVYTYTGTEGKRLPSGER